MSFLNGARWLNGAIEGVLNWVPSTNRVINLPDKSGTVALTEDLRIKATSQPIFYVSTTGSDSNNGLTVGTPFLTLPRAIDVLTTIDCNGFDPIIYLAAGTYVQPLGGLVLKSCTGVATRVTIIGEAGANRINYKIQAQAASSNDLNATAIAKNTPTAYRFVGVEIGANFSHANYPKYVRAATPIEFEDCCFRGNNNTHDGVVSYASNTITFLGITQLEGTFRWPLDMLHSFVAFLPLGAQKPTFTTSSGCEFAVFLNGANTTCLAHDTVHSGTGSFVGKRFELIEGRVETYNEGAGLPGNSAGTVTYPGVSGGSGSTDLSIDNRTSTTLDILSSSGAPTTLPAATTTLSGLFTGADKAKLNNAIESTQLGANNGVAQLGSTGKHLPGQALPNSVTYTASTGVLAFTWADGATQNIDLPVENLFQNASYNSSTQTLTLTTNGGGTLDISLATLVDLPEIVVAQSDPATTPTTGQRLYLRSDTGEYWIAASGAWQGKYLTFTAAERSKLSGIESGAINQTSVINLIWTGLGDHVEDPDPHSVYRLKSVNIPANEITGTFQDSQIPSSVARGTEVVAAVTTHEAALDPHPGYRLESEQIPTTDVADLAEFVRDTIGATLAQGSNITITPDDPGNTITISATPGGGFTPVLQQYETVGTTATFQAPSGATRLKGRIIGAGGAGSGGRQGAAGTNRGSGAGGAAAGVTDFDVELAQLATFLSTTVSNLFFDVVIPAGATGAAGTTTPDTNGNFNAAGNGPETLFRVRVGSDGSPTNLFRAGGGTRAFAAGTNTSGGTGGNNSGFSVSGGTSTGSCSQYPGGLGVNGNITGLKPSAPALVSIGPGGGGAGCGISSADVAGLGGDGGSAGAVAIVAGPTTSGANAAAHGIPWLPGAGGAGGSSNGTGSRNGGNGYRGGGGGGGGASPNGTASGGGGNGGDGYACLLWY